MSLPKARLANSFPTTNAAVCVELFSICEAIVFSIVEHEESVFPIRSSINCP